MPSRLSWLTNCCTARGKMSLSSMGPALVSPVRGGTRCALGGIDVQRAQIRSRH